MKRLNTNVGAFDPTLPETIWPLRLGEAARRPMACVPPVFPAGKVTYLPVTRYRLGQRRRITRLGAPRELGDVLWRRDLDRDFPPCTIGLHIGRRVGDRVVIPQVVGDRLHELIDFVQSLRKERLTASEFGELDEIGLGFL